MIKSIYNFYLLFKFELLKFVGMQTNDISILVDNNFTSIKEKIIKSAKIMIKDKKYFIFAYSLIFNNV